MVSDELSFDVGESGQAASAFAMYMLFQFLYEALQMYLYWLMGEVHAAPGGGGGEAGAHSRQQQQQQQEEEEEEEKEGARAGEIARTIGILRSWESIGNTVAYAVGVAGVSNMMQLVFGFVVWGCTVPFTLWAIYLGGTPVDGDSKGVVVVHHHGDEHEYSGTSVGGREGSIKGHVLVVEHNDERKLES